MRRGSVILHVRFFFNHISTKITVIVEIQLFISDCTDDSSVLIPVAARSKAWVWGRWLARIAGANSAGGMDVLSLVSVVGRELDVPASSLSLLQRSPTDCDASLCVIVKPR
jgi:hypothetical protein